MGFFGHTGTMERFNFFIQVIHCNIFKQVRVADVGMHKVYMKFAYIFVCYLNLYDGVDAFVLKR